MSTDHVNLMLLNMSFGTLPPPFKDAHPTCGLILGSGWSQALPDAVVATRVGYDRIVGLGPGTVAGHAGELRLVRWHGVTAIAFCGRRHWYEGEGWTPVVLPVELMRRLGVRDVLLTNAAGGIRANLHPGDFLLIRDHINTVGINPLQGPLVPGWGSRFPDQSQIYNPDLRRLLQAASQDAAVTLTEGIYAFTAGPTYETPAEIRSYAAMGADAVGMSTVPEAMVANAAGLRVAAVSCISNLAAGIGGPRTQLDHADVLTETQRVTPQMTRLLEAFLKRLGKTGPSAV
jgi:purine-nucleoside phosphorylase